MSFVQDRALPIISFNTDITQKYHQRRRQHRAITVDTNDMVYTVDAVDAVDTVDKVYTVGTVDIVYTVDMTYNE